jgi:uncharacterized protein YbcV (DUF1398 family)
MKSFTWKNNKTVHFGEITEILENNNGILIARYKTEIMFGFYNPLIKIDTNRKLIYFLAEHSFNGETSFPQFETRGIKAEIYK